MQLVREHLAILKFNEFLAELNGGEFGVSSLDSRLAGVGDLAGKAQRDCEAFGGRLGPQQVHLKLLRFAVRVGNSRGKRSDATRLASLGRHHRSRQIRHLDRGALRRIHDVTHVVIRSRV